MTLQEGWNDINEMLAVYVENGYVLRGLHTNGLEQKAVWMYKSFGKGATLVEKLPVKDFIKKYQAGKISFI